MIDYADNVLGVSKIAYRFKKDIYVGVFGSLYSLSELFIENIEGGFLFNAHNDVVDRRICRHIDVFEQKLSGALVAFRRYGHTERRKGEIAVAHLASSICRALTS